MTGRTLLEWAEVERLIEDAYFTAYKSGMANEADDWNKPDDEIREFAKSYVSRLTAPNVDEVG